MKILLTVMLIGCCVGLRAQDQWKNIYSQHAWTERDKWQKPGELIKLLEIDQGDAVADVGCHEGYMSFKLAKHVGSTGTVYAVDLDQGKLDKVKARAEESNIKQIRTVKGTENDPGLPENALDGVLILDTYHEMDAHAEVLQHIKSALKKGGRLLICEPIADARKDLTRSEQERRHELGLGFALDDLRKAGFEIVLQKENFIDRTSQKGDRMWVVVALKI